MLPHGRNLRRGRVSQPWRAYLLTAVTHDRRPLFRDWVTGRLLVAELHEAATLGQADSLAWVVMPDHLHWLLTLRCRSLGELMQRVKSRSARAVNRRLGEDRRVWQPGYHDHAVRGDEDLRALARYVVANPLRQGLVADMGAYPLWDAIWL